jgi:hypothetical protein
MTTIWSLRAEHKPDSSVFATALALARPLDE